VILSLINGGDKREKAGVLQGAVVGAGGHALDGIDGVGVVSGEMLDGDQALPGAYVGGIVVEDVAIESGRLLVAFAVDEETRVLQAHAGLHVAAIVGEWQGQCLGEHALGFGILAR
jgi:hypothetical protein